ncbi:suppressor of fused domain protein [Paenibacillus flagellatus]|uniref:Suppressor of fused protein (SUFU) n=1 Tax=Paenibacillus flagellatus TaxID=2211139 RepID=A0A2V5KLE0_9BACL|nr:suppressor of fused domain protein [Paenibacillus flagellatus]PYI51607.1 Suppressor of fused protein (SUFU) [Paenibacillus flagellatus]
MSFFKKLFGGKNNGETAKDGTVIYSYDGNEDNGYTAPAPMEYTEEIVDHFMRAFPNRTCGVFHEIISDLVHIDVNVMEPTEREPFWILYTTGMSDLPMTLPEEILEELGDGIDRAELMIFLPTSWEMSEQAFKDDNNYWPIRLMKQLARFPHQYNTWLSYGHTIPNYREYEPYAEGTGLNGVVLYKLDDDLSVIPTKDGNKVHAYFLVPLYREEMEYKLEYGMEALMEKLFELGNDALVLNPKRKNTCA